MTVKFYPRRNDDFREAYQLLKVSKITLNSSPYLSFAKKKKRNIEAMIREAINM